MQQESEGSNFLLAAAEVFKQSPSVLIFRVFSLTKDFCQKSGQSVLDMFLSLRSLIALFILRKGKEIIVEDQEDLREQLNEGEL